jgi:hypothetical protein
MLLPSKARATVPADEYRLPVRRVASSREDLVNVRHEGKRQVSTSGPFTAEFSDMPEVKL